MFFQFAYEDEDESSEESERKALLSTTTSCIEPTTRNKYSLTVSYFDSEESCNKAYDVEASLRWIPSHSQKFTNIAVVDSLIHSFVCKKEAAEVGHLQGTVLVCPNDDFLNVADNYNSELLSVAMKYCDRYGNPNRLKHPEIKAQEEHGSGDFFHIDGVEIHPDHTGRDLGVRMVYEALKLVPWTLVVLVPGPLEEYTFSRREKFNSKQKFFHRKDTSLLLDSSDEEEEDDGDREEEEELIRHQCASKKICLQLARLGFVQAGRNPDDCDSWFLTKKKFDDANGSTNPSEMKLISKDEVAATVDPYFPPKMHKPSQVDLELGKYVGSQTRKYEAMAEEHAQNVAIIKTGQELLEKCLLDTDEGSEESKQIREETKQSIQKVRQQLGTLEEIYAKEVNDHLATTSEGISVLLAGGASLDGARVFHLYAANMPSSFSGTGVLKILVDQGASIDMKAEMGFTPLSLAAQLHRNHVIEFLLSLGADPTTKDLSGKTAVEQFVSKYHFDRDKARVMGYSGVAPQEIDCVPVFESAKAFMSKSHPGNLKDGMLPPRMHHMLSCTANSVVRSLKDIEKFDPDIFGWFPEEAMQNLQEFRVHYIPVVEVQFHYDPPKEYWRILLNGYKSFWKAISDILQNGQSPTVDNIRRKLEEGQNGSADMYECWRGIKIEYALDALFDEASKAYKEQEYKEHATDEKMKELPESPLDEMYDVLWCMCVRRGGGEWENSQPRGPFNNDWRNVCECSPNDPDDDEEGDSDDDDDEEEELEDEEGDSDEEEEDGDEERADEGDNSDDGNDEEVADEEGRQLEH